MQSGDVKLGFANKRMVFDTIDLNARSNLTGDRFGPRARQNKNPELQFTGVTPREKSPPGDPHQSSQAGMRATEEILTITQVTMA